MKGNDVNLIVVLGPTATGKTRFAARLARVIQGEIISADSRQVYRHMDLGTGKDYDDYRVDGHSVPFHLIDICDPGDKYNVYQFQKDFRVAFADIHKRQHMPILCGGTGMYIEAVAQGYALPAVEINHELRERLKDKSLAELRDILAGYGPLHNRSDTDTRPRALRAIEIQEHCRTHPLDRTAGPEIHPLFLGMHMEREQCRARIAKRLHQRLAAGMVDEVRALLNSGLKPEDLIYYGLEYKFITLFVTGEMNYETMVQKLYTAICQFSKRQMTWFRKMQRSGIEILWIDALLNEEDRLKSALELIRLA